MHNSKLSWVVPVLVLAIGLTVQGVKVSIYDKVNYGGNQVDMDIQTCTNVPNNWNDQTASIKMKTDGCVALYEHNDCNGKSIQVTSDTASLTPLKFQSILTSMDVCPLPPPPGMSRRECLCDNDLNPFDTKVVNCYDN